MLSKTHNYQFNGGVAPYTWTVTGTDPDATITPSSGTAAENEAISFTVTFPNLTSYVNSVVTLAATDSEDGTPCSTSTQITYTDPCQNFALVPIFNNAGFTFSSSANFLASDICSGVIFNWLFDGSVWETVSQTDDAILLNSRRSTLTLKLKNPGESVPEQTQIHLTATDCFGCTQTESFTYSFTIPEAKDFSVDLKKTSDGTKYQLTNIKIPELVGTTQGTDYSKLIINFPEGFTYTSPTEDTISLTIDATVATATSYTGSYSIVDNSGLRSTTGKIFINLVDSLSQTITIPDKIFQVDCGTLVGNSVRIYLTDQLVMKESGVTLDYTSWTLVTPPVSSSPSITLDFDGQGPWIDYEVPALTGSDTFSWTICDTNGNCADAAHYTMILDCGSGDVPTAVADSGCVTCGSTVSLDVLANDTAGGSPLLQNSIAITSAPFDGVTSLPGDGNVIYTPNSDFQGVDTFDYTVNNSGGGTSNSATVSVTVICAGQDSSGTGCTGDSITLYNFLPDPKTTGGTWTAISGGGPVPGSYNASITIGSTGTYVYRYTVTSTTCTHTADVTLTVQNANLQRKNDWCASGTLVGSLSSSGQSATLFDYTAEFCPYMAATLDTITNNHVDPWGAVTPIGGDKWYYLTVSPPVNTNLSITIDGTPYAGAGIIQPIVALYDTWDCNSAATAVAEDSTNAAGQTSVTLNYAVTSGTFYEFVFKVNSGNTGHAPGQYDITCTLV